MLHWLLDLSLRKRLELLAIVLLVPFWFGSLWHGHMGNVVGAVVASLAFLVSFITPDNHPLVMKVRAASTIAPGLVVWGIVSFSPEYASYWSFPFMLFLYFQLEIRRAVVANIIFVGGMGVLLAEYMAAETVARFVAAQVLANGFAVFFAHDRQTSEERLRQLAVTDSLTGLLNRRETMRLLQEALDVRARYGQSSTLLMIDLDFFKAINDRYGHIRGDEVLVAFAGLMKERVRSLDLLGRIGGEEFLILLRHTGIREATEVAEQLLESCRRHRFPIEEQVTVSIGLAECAPNYALPDWLRAADEALYEAKEQGRDTCVCATMPDQPRQVA